MWSELGSLWQAIFYPQRCPECKRIINGQALLCTDCRTKLQNIRFLHTGTFGGKHLAGACLLYAYEGGVKEALHGVKYLRRKGLLARLAAEVKNSISGKKLAELWRWQAIMVVPIPTEPTRRKDRGYDIPREIFLPWCRQEGLLWQETLRRRAGSRPQYGLDKKARKDNVAESFQVSGNVQGKTVLLVDDIFTTGATMEEAARLLKKAGAQVVWGLAFSGGRET